MIYIGSYALKKMYPDFPRTPEDIDVLSKSESVDIIKKFLKDAVKKIDVHHIVPLFTHCMKNQQLTGDELLTLKVSHIFWDISWNKHMFDIQFLIDKGHKIDMELFNELYDYWTMYHGEVKRSDLNKTAEEFFNNAVKCEYDHDYLHTLIKEVPTFNKVLKDGAEVDVSEDKFNALSFEEKCDLVFEEVYVMAYERMGNLDYREAYSRMLKKFIINHAPIWEALFIIQNFKVLHKPKINYKKLIDSKLYELNRKIERPD